MRRISSAFVTLLVLASCGGGAPAVSAPAAPATVAATVAPTATPSRAPAAVLDVPVVKATLRAVSIPVTDTDPSLTVKLEPHYVVFDPGAAPRGQLFVFLTGMAPTPAQGTLIVRQAAANGFHAIGLSFFKIANERTYCEANADETCYEKMRLAAIRGGELPPNLSIPAAASIEQLLSKLVTHLSTKFPSEGWGAYVQSGAPKWEAIRLGGLSQGGSHAAVMARDRALARVCLFESPIDLLGAPGAASRKLPPWTAMPRATPAERTYGFRSAKSDNQNAPAFPLAWTAFGLDRFGPAVDTDTAKPPYDGSHQLTTKADPAVNDGAANLIHRSVVIDSVTPKTPSGAPLFAPVWQYACFS